MIVRKWTKWGLYFFMPNIQFGKIPIFPNYSAVGGAKNTRRPWNCYVFYMVVHPSTGHQNPSYLSPSSPIYFHLNFFPYISIPIFIYYPHIFFNSPSSVIFLLLNLFYHLHLWKKFFYFRLPASPNPKNHLSSSISKPTYFKLK